MTASNGLVILISGRGSNALALIKASQTGLLPAPVKAVVSDKSAPGLAMAASLGVDTAVVPRSRFRSRESFEHELADVINGFSPQLITLAGFMRVLSSTFVEKFCGRMVNIHPSLLPRYRGLGTHARALAAGDDEHGASVHWVVPTLDAGPVFAQARVPIQRGDDPERLAARVLEQEHRLYPAALALLLNEQVEMPHEDSKTRPPLLLDRDFNASGQRLGVRR